MVLSEEQHCHPRGFLMRVVVAARLSQLVTDPNDKTPEGRKKSIQTGLDTQEKEVIRDLESKGHEIVGIAADFKSGTTFLSERPNLKPWVTEPEMLTQYDALAALKVDRITRADDEGVDRVKKWARDNGKKILITSADVHFPSEGMEGVRWDLYIRMAHQEWLDIRERYMRMQAGRNDIDSIVGRPPWGYEIIKYDGRKVIVPTNEGRIWVPSIFEWIAEGKSCRFVSQQLEDNYIKSLAPDGRWHEARIGSMIRGRTYSGQRVRKGRAALEVEPLVSRALQDKAIAKLESRARLGGTGKKLPKVLLAKLKCGNPECPGNGEWPMYRNQNRYYRCTGKGANRQGCGTRVIDIETLDRLVLDFSAYWDKREHVTQRFVSGNDAGQRLERLNNEAAEAFRAAPASEKMRVAAEYAEKIAAIEAEGSIEPHWEDVHTGETEGDHLRKLSLDEKREYLARKEIRAWKDPDGKIHVWVDGLHASTGGYSHVAEVIAGLK
jgi:DNA invertase Pin-like site-specific DNA recombinase